MCIANTVFLRIVVELKPDYLLKTYVFWPCTNELVISIVFAVGLISTSGHDIIFIDQGILTKATSKS